MKTQVQNMFQNILETIFYKILFVEDEKYFSTILRIN